MTYGIINLKGGNEASITNFTNAGTIDQFARIRIKVLLKEEGKETTDESIFQYCQEWLETLIENSDGETTFTMADVPDQAADNIVYSNALYCQIEGVGKKAIVTQLTPVQSKEMYDAIVKKLSDVISKFSPVCTE